MSVVGKASTSSIECDGELIMTIFCYSDIKETEADVGGCIQTRMVKEIVDIVVRVARRKGATRGEIDGCAHLKANQHVSRSFSISVSRQARQAFVLRSISEPNARFSAWLEKTCLLRNLKSGLALRNILAISRVAVLCSTLFVFWTITLTQ